MTNRHQANKTRSSSIELLKVIGIILIVISHVVQTLSETNTNITYQDYIVNLEVATTNIQYLILSMLRYTGYLGNTLFFVCSAWFLLDSSKVNKRKILQMLMDIWVISIVIFVAVYILRSGDIGIKLIITQFFPNIFANNWYVTCYLLFYPIHPFLNMVINKVEQPVLLKTTLVMLFLYFGLNYLYSELFFASRLILWITVYFAMAYMKLYLVDMSNNIRINAAIFVFGFIGNCGIIVLTNIIGLRISIFSDWLLFGNPHTNPFILLMGIGLFNLARNVHIESKAINYVSQLSMLIYVFHENRLLRIYYRPMMWQYVFLNIGYDHILLWTFLMAVIVFMFGLISSIIYKYTIQKCVTKAGDILYPKLCEGYSRIEKMLLKLN